MDRKRILIVSKAFYPTNSPRSFRTTELAKELSRQGHQITVLIPKEPVHERIEKELGITINDLGHLDESELVDFRKKKLNIFEKALNRFRVQFLLYPQLNLRDLVCDALEQECGKNYDLLISIAAPHSIHWGVAKAMRNYQDLAKVWIADCGDPFMLAENLHFKRPFYFKFLEKEFCRRADFITIPTVDAKAGYYPEFQSKLRVIPQGFRFEDVRVSLNQEKGGQIRFGYAGSLIKGRRDPSELIRYLIEEDIDFKFIIYSKHKAFAEELAKEFKDKILFMGEANREDLLYHLSELDFVVNFENVGTNQSPSKLIDYAIIKKPILSVRFGDLNKPVVDEFIKKEYRNQLLIENPDQFRIENVAKKFIALSTNDE